MFTKLLGEWCAHGEVVPGFKRYAMEHLGGEACVLGLLRGNMDARDAATVALLGGWRGGGGGGGRQRAGGVFETRPAGWLLQARSPPR